MQRRFARAILRQLLLASLFTSALFLLPSAALAQNNPLYWDITGAGAWNTPGFWNSNPDGVSGSNAVPDGSHDAVFSANNALGNTTAQLSGPQSVLGLYFNNTGTTAINSTTAGSALSIGADGIIITSSAGAVTLGDATNTMPLDLVGSQTWTNNSANALTVVNAVSLDSSINVPSTLTLNSTSTANNVISGLISDGGSSGATLGLNVTAGTWTLSGNNTFSGGTTIGTATSAGTLRLSGSPNGTVRTLGALTNNTTVMSGSTLDLNGSSLAAYTGTIRIAGTGVGGVGAITNSSGTGIVVPQGLSNVTLTGDASIGGVGRLDIDGSLNGGGFTLTKVGGNYMAMKGTVTNLANLIIDSGVWEVANSSGLGSGSVTVNPSGIITFFTPPATPFSNSFTLSGGEVGVAAGGPATLSGAFTLTSGTTSLLGGSVSGIPNNQSMSVSGPIGGGGNLQAGNAGTGAFVTLSGANNYSGTTTIAGGILEFANEGALYGGDSTKWTSANINVNPGTTLALGVGAAPQFNSADASTLLTNLGSGFQSGAILGLDTSNATSPVTYSNPITDANGGANVLNLTKIGSGTLIFTAANTYTGATVINAGGTLQIGDGVNTGSLPAASVVTDNGTLAYNLPASAPMTVTNPIGGSGGLAQIGQGTVTLANLNTYSGSTVVTAGTLRLAPQAAPTAGLQAHYAFEGNANDSTPNANHGTLVNGPTFVTGVSGQAVNFNGANQYVSLPNTSSLALSGQYTVSFWENLNSPYASQPDGNPTFVSTRNGTNNTAFDIQLSGTGLHADIGTDTGGWLTTGADANVSLPVGAWEMVTYSVSSTGYNIYVDGAKVGSGGYSGTPVFMATSNTSQFVSIGSQAAGNGSPNSGNALNGAVDELSFYNRALTASEVSALYGSSSAGNILPTTTSLIVGSSGTVDLQGINQTVASLADFSAGNGGVVTNSATTPVTLTVNPASGSTTFSGTIRDSGISNAITLVKSGAGTQVLTGVNTYSGPTNIQNGTLVLGNAAGNTISATSSVVLGNASPSSAGMLQLGNATNAANQTVASLSNLSSTSVSSVVGGNSAISTLTINNNSLVTYTGNFGGLDANQNNLGVTKTGSGTLAFGGAATNSGPTVISNGTLRLTTQGAAPAVLNGSFESPVIGGGGFTYNASLTPAQVSALVWVAGGNSAGNGIGPAVVNNSPAWGYSTPYPNGNQAMTMQSTSFVTQMLTFANAGTYTVSWSAEQRPGNSAPGVVMFNNATVDTFTAPGSSSWTQYSTTISVPSAGSYPLEFAGTTPSDQSYGLDNIAVSGGLSPNSQMQIASGAFLDLNGTSQNVLSLANSGSTGGTVTNNAIAPSALIVVPAAATSATFDGSLQDGSGSVRLTVNGPGTQILTGANKYSGGTNVQNGTLVLGTSSGTNVGSIAASSSVVLGNGTTGGIFQLGDASNPVNQSVASLTTSGSASTNSVVGGNATTSILTINNNSLVTYNGNFGGTGTNQNNLGITKTGSGTLVFGGIATNSGPTVISNGTLRVTASAAPNLLNPSFESPIIGNNSYIYTGSPGFTPANLAALVWAVTGDSGTGTVLVNNSSAWGYTTPYPNGNQAINLQRVGTVAQTLNFASPGTYTLTWQAEGRPNFGSDPAVLTLDGTTVDSFTAPLTAWTTYSATINVATVGPHTIEFAGTATNDTSVAIDNVVFGGGGLSSASPLQIGSSGTLDLDGTVQDVLSLANSGVGGGTVTNSSPTLAGTLAVVPAASTTATFGGSIQDGASSVGVTISGLGTQVLSGVNTYSGPTNIFAGTLRVTGSIANSPVNVSGGTLAGTGVTGPVTLTSGAISPGFNGAIGTLSTGNLRIAAGSSLNYTLGNSGVGSLISAGALTLPTTAAAVTINVTDNAGANGQGSVGSGTYPLIDYTSLSGGNASNFASTFTGAPPAALAGKSFNVFNTGAGVGALLLTISQTNPVLYQDTFNRNGNLNGSTPTIENGSQSTWNANAGWTTATTNGGQASPPPGGNTSALLPFTPAVNSLYTISTDVNVTAGGSNWFVLGFANGGANTGVNPNNNGSAVWILDRNNSGGPQIFQGAASGSSGGNIGGPYANSSGTGTLSMVLATGSTLSNSTVYILVNGTQAEAITGFNASNVNQLIIGDGGASGTFQNLTLATGSYWLATSAATGSTASWSNNTVATDTNSSFDPSQLSGWSGGVVPDSAGAMATFGASIGANDSTITLDGNRTVGELTFANSAFNMTGNYTIAAGTSVPTSTLTLDNAGAGGAVTNYYGNNIISVPVVLNDNVQLMIGNGSSLTLSGGLTDTGSHRIDVDPTGTNGNLTLSAASNTPGAMNIYGGTVTYAPGSSNSGGGAYTLFAGNGATLTINTSGNTIAASSLALGTGTAVNLNAGTLRLTGNVSSLSGQSPTGINFNGGTLRNGNTGSTAISIGASVPLTIGGVTATIDTTGGNINSAAAISGAGTLRVQGANTLSLSAASSYTAATLVSSGTLGLQNTAALGNTSSVTVANGAALQLAGVSGSPASYGASADASVASIATSLSGSGIGGSGALVSTSGINTFTGAITLVGPATIGSSSSNLADSLTLTGAVNTNSNNLLTFTGTNSITVSSTGISGGGGLTYNGAGTLNLAVGSTYGGTTTVNSGTLRVSNSTGFATGNGAAVSINSTAHLVGTGLILGSVNIAAGATVAPTSGGLAGASNSVGTLRLGGLTLNSNSNGSSTVNYQATGSPATSNLTIDSINLGSGTLTLPSTGTSFNPVEFNFYQPGTLTPYSFGLGVYPLITYGSVINGGSNLNSVLNLETGSVPMGDTATFTTTNTPGTLDLVISNASIITSSEWISTSNTNYSGPTNWAPTGAPNSAGSTATFGANNSVTAITIDVPVTLGTLAFNGGNSFTLTAMNDTNSLTMNNNSNGANVNVAAGSNNTVSASMVLAETTTFNIDPMGSLLVESSNSGANPVAISGTGGLTLNGGGVLSLTSANTYHGATVVNAGVLQVVGGSIANTSSVTIASTATLQLAGAGTPQLSSTTTVNNHGSAAASPAGGFTVTGSNQVAGVVTGAATTNVSDGTVTYDGDTTVGDGSLTDLTVTQILQNTLTIDANATVTIAPSGPGFSSGVATASASNATAAVASNSTPSADGSDDPSSDALSVIQAAIASGSISNTKGQQLENRIAAIERLATTDPGLDVSLLDSRVLASLPSTSVWSATGSPLPISSGSGLLALDSSTFSSGSTSGSAAFAPAAGFAGSPAAVPEPSSLLLAALAGIGVLFAIRRRTICRT